MRSNPENGMASTPWIPLLGSCSTGFWGTVRHPGRPRGRSRGAQIRQPGDQDRALAVGRDRIEVIVPTDLVDDQPGILGHRPELVDSDEPQGVVPDPTDRGPARCTLLVDR